VAMAEACSPAISMGPLHRRPCIFPLDNTGLAAVSRIARILCPRKYRAKALLQEAAERSSPTLDKYLKQVVTANLSDTSWEGRCGEYELPICAHLISDPAAQMRSRFMPAGWQRCSRIRPPTSYCKYFLLSIYRKGMRAASGWRCTCMRWALRQLLLDQRR